jgi:hypothetical protein
MNLEFPFAIWVVEFQDCAFIDQCSLREQPIRLIKGGIRFTGYDRSIVNSPKILRAARDRQIVPDDGQFAYRGLARPSPKTKEINLGA